MKIQQVSERLNYYAEWYVLSRGYAVRDGARGLLQGLVNNAVATLYPGQVGDFEVDPSDPRIGQAEAAIALFVSTMIVARDDLKGFADAFPGEIGEPTFLWASSRLCPLFPIC